MKKIFNRVLAAAIAVPMTLTQGVLMTVTAEDTGAKALGVDTFFAIPADQLESTWNITTATAIANMNGQTIEVLKDDLVSLLPATNRYGVILQEILGDSDVSTCNVVNGVFTITGSVDLSNYAEEKIYSKVNAALGYDVEMDAFNKVVEFTVTVDTNTLADDKTADADVVITCDGTELTEDNTADYFNGLVDELYASVDAQVGGIDNLENADAVKAGLTVELVDKLEKAEKWANNAETLARTGSYATADEMMAAIDQFVSNRTPAYDFPNSVDEAVARHGQGANKLVELFNKMAVSSGYTLDVTAADVAEVVKSGSEFEVAVSGGTYELTFKLEDAEAAEVEAYVNETAEEGKEYDYSYKIVEASATTEGVVYFNVKREIVLKDVEATTTATTTVTTGTDDVTGSDTTTTTTGTDDVTGSDTTTTTTGTDDVTGSDTTTTTTVTGTGEVTGTGTGNVTGSDTTTGTGTSDTTTETTTTLDKNFVLESIEAEGGEDYYFSHDENAFDLGSLMNSLTLVGNIDGVATTYVISPNDYAKYLTPDYATPAEYFNSVEGVAYVASQMGITFTAPADMQVADTFDGTITSLPTVYIGVKGDADLNGVVEIPDATAVLTYYAMYGASLTPAFNTDASLEKLAYFLADVDTESKAGVNTDEAQITISDATMILTYYAQFGASLDPDWDAIIGR